MSTTVPDSRLLAVDEVARLLRVSPKTVYRRVWDGSLPALRLGEGFGPLRIDERELSEWLYGDAGGSAPLVARQVPDVRGVPAVGQSTAPQHAGLEEEA